jgi:hypothetical protein
MPAFIFTCPKTSMKVQHWIDDDRDSEENRYEALTCPACSNVHFINLKTKKLLSEKNHS